MENLLKKLNEKDSGIQIAADLSHIGLVILKLKGTLDTFNSKDFVETSLDILENFGLNALVFDLEDFVYINATGVNALIDITIECLSKYKKVYLLNTEKKVSEIFKLLGLYNQFRLIGDLSEVGKTNSFFPRRELCLECRGKLNLFKPGKFDCPSCKQKFKIDEKGFIERIRR